VFSSDKYSSRLCCHEVADTIARFGAPLALFDCVNSGESYGSTDGAGEDPWGEVPGDFGQIDDRDRIGPMLRLNRLPDFLLK
jgi:hypothetical protein